MNKFTTPGKTKVVNATILAPENSGLRFIINTVNQDGTFTSKLDLLLSKRWSKVRENYKEWFSTQMNFKLGSINYNCATSSDTWVVQMLVRDKTGKVDPVVLQRSVQELSKLAKGEKASVHVSSYLTDEHPLLKDLLVKYLVEEGVGVYFYVEPQK